MGQIKFIESIEISSNDAAVFDYTQNYDNRLKWDTFLKRADLISGARAAGVGVKAFCVAKNGIGMETEYVTFNRPKVTAVKMTSRSAIFRSFVGSWTFKRLSDDRTDVIFIYSYDLKFPFSLAERLIKNNLQKNVQLRLQDLKYHIEKLR